ncbi:hypothetical protein D3C71_1705730 [compost metagenome]
MGQVVLDRLFQRPVAIANHIAVVGVGEQPRDPLGTAQFQLGIGEGGGTQGKGGEGEAQSWEFEHAQILFSVGPGSGEQDILKRLMTQGPVSV